MNYLMSKNDRDVMVQVIQNSVMPMRDGVKLTTMLLTLKPENTPIPEKVKPDEVKNVADSRKYAPVLADLQQRLRAWQEETGDPWVVKYEHE